jgi:hypothetical protein
VFRISSFGFPVGSKGVGRVLGDRLVCKADVHSHLVGSIPTRPTGENRVLKFVLGVFELFRI